MGNFGDVVEVTTAASWVFLAHQESKTTTGFSRYVAVAHHQRFQQNVARDEAFIDVSWPPRQQLVASLISSSEKQLNT
jgi:hypothetical protein